MNEPQDNQDKRAWCEKYGLTTEQQFVTWAQSELQLAVCLNPQKATDPYTFDLLLNGKPADLKTVRTPFYRASELYNTDPQYAVTFNRKDGERYRALYPDISVIFDVLFDGKKHRLGVVRSMRLIATGQLNDIATAITKSGTFRHDYKERTNDTKGNAKDSWVFDVRYLTKLYEITPFQYDR